MMAEGVSDTSTFAYCILQGARVPYDTVYNISALELSGTFATFLGGCFCLVHHELSLRTTPFALVCPRRATLDDLHG